MNDNTSSFKDISVVRAFAGIAMTPPR
jgi:hypothetical protein